MDKIAALLCQALPVLCVGCRNALIRRDSPPLINADLGAGMFDLAHQQVMQRSAGSAMVQFAQNQGRTALKDLAQTGSAKAMLPRVFTGTPEVVFLNTSGGLTGGDQLGYRMVLGDGAQVLATTQTAERAYATTGDMAQVRVSAALGAGAHLDWLPQETILYEHAHVNRRTEIDLAEGSSLLLVESLVLGRKAMGEMPQRARLTDHRMVRRCGRPFWAETLHINSDVLGSVDRPAVFGGAKAMAVIAHIAGGAADAAPAVHQLPVQDSAQMAVSGWNGRCIIRILATDSWPLRQQIIRVVTTLRRAPMPRVWQC
jgi:urease accessory protein